jgi:hypothetical protein
MINDLYGINLIGIDQIRIRNFLPPATLEEHPRGAELVVRINGASDARNPVKRA